MIARRLIEDREGATIVEFAIVVPLFLMLLLGIMDVGQMVYGKSVLTGAVHRAARSASLETRNTSEADASVLDAIKPVLPGVTIKTSRTSYYDFADVGRAEKWNDKNANAVCDAGETYTDENRNGQWDQDVGQKDSSGSANDVIVYKVTATFKPVFRVPLLPKLWGDRTLTATAVTKNQPFGNQTSYGAAAGSCP
ncbi:TadE/TadG family type IV pilus assembly protein [Novosphingobium taihuense]|uniref:Flp pilus assembly protein TadG n=1 Tax=Novosphingobium taihuense TaxID=260085 RepID=A0A7W7ETR4_9SPHN|nr:TadE family protein [Novosphingobium taihuense]MBB4613294.1 Flp pilus assembly protein TadG [Novosphingobium taihuense]TWH85435.1 TadE-like protein [Novosphingobium taihuense]